MSRPWRGHRHFAIAFGVLLAASACAGPSPEAGSLQAAERPIINETESNQSAEVWRSFSSDRYGVQFQYPDACGVSEANDSIYVGGAIGLNVLDAKGLSLSEFVGDFVDGKVKNGSWRVETTTRGSIAGVEAITVEYRFGGVGRFGTATFAQRDGRIYAWQYSAGSVPCDEPNIYSDILSSFRFIARSS